MVKKLIFWSAIIVGGLVLINTVKPGAVTTWGKRIHARLEKKISPEFELARIRDQIKQLTPDMHRNIERIASETVAVAALESKVTDMQVRLDEQKAVITAMTDALASGNKKVSFGGRELTPSQIKAKLRSYTEGEKALDYSKKQLEVRKGGLESARAQLVEMKNQKEQLQLLVDQFEAEIQALKLEQTRSKVALDDSRLSEIKDSLDRLRQRVDAEREKAKLTGQFFGTGTFTEEKKGTSAEDVISEVREKFGSEVKSDAAKK